MKVLVVDDVALVLRKLANFLEQQNFNVVTAGSATDALEILKRDNRIELVLTDLLMPTMDGIELFKAANKIERVSDEGTAAPPKFILMTAARPDRMGETGIASQLQEAIDLGFVDVVFKPFNYDKLAKLILEAVKVDFTNGHVLPSADAPPAETEAIRRLEELIARINRKHEQLQQEVNTLRDGHSRLEDELSEVGKLIADSRRLLQQCHGRPDA